MKSGIVRQISIEIFTCFSLFMSVHFVRYLAKNSKAVLVAHFHLGLSWTKFFAHANQKLIQFGLRFADSTNRRIH